MSIIKISMNGIVSAETAVTDCPAYRSDRDSEIKTTGKTISFFDSPRWYKGKEVVAALGPFVCKACEIGCQKAYFIANQEQADIIVNTGVKVSETPVTIRLVEEETFPQMSEPSPIASPDSDGREKDFGWRRRFEDSLVNAAIDIYRTDVISAGPDGTLSTHKGSFQPELEFEVTLAAPVVEPTEQIGQQRLF